MPGDTIPLTFTVPPDVQGPAILEVDFEVEAEKGGTNSWPFYIDVCPNGYTCAGIFN
jgi:hypothetical protein